MILSSYGEHPHDAVEEWAALTEPKLNIEGNLMFLHGCLPVWHLILDPPSSPSFRPDFLLSLILAQCMWYLLSVANPDPGSGAFFYPGFGFGMKKSGLGDSG
jgi:hypothetical protein